MRKGVGRFLAVPRLDALAKVTGSERYSADMYSGEFLWAGTKRAFVPHAASCDQPLVPQLFPRCPCSDLPDSAGRQARHDRNHQHVTRRQGHPQWEIRPLEFARNRQGISAALN